MMMIIYNNNNLNKYIKIPKGNGTQTTCWFGQNEQ